MALPRGELSILLRDLRAAGPVDRVRLLARSLSSLRRLSPWDRKILLRMAGFEGAEALVERLAQDDEATAGRLRHLLAELEKEPETLERTVRELADPKRRSQAVDELLATLDRGMAAEDEPEPAAPFPDPQPAPVPGPPPVPPPGVAPLPEAPPVPERPVPLARPSPAPRVPPKEAPAPAPPPPPVSARSPVKAPPVPAVGAAPEPRLPAEVEREAEPAPEPAPEARPSPAPPPPIQAPPSIAAAPPEAADGAPASASRVLDRLLALRRGSGGEAPDAESLGRTLEREIPFPWARRRALQAWIEAGGATDLDGALELIGELPAAADRTWCLATLMAHGAWSDAERERIAAAAPTPAARRRLESRRAG